MLDILTTYYAVYFCHLYESNSLVRFLLAFPPLHLAFELTVFILLFQITNIYSAMFAEKGMQDYSFLIFLMAGSFRLIAFVNNVLAIL